MKQIWSKSLACLLCLALLVGMLPVAALAEDPEISYIDAEGSTKTCPSATAVTGSDTTWGADDNVEHWYVVNGDVTISSRVTVTGDVHLILADECTLNATKGINVTGTNSLTIYGQAEGTGTLTADGGENSLSSQAGIGGNDNQPGGTITINGGTVNATGASYMGTGGAGIGGGNGCAGGEITINGGTVTANGGDRAAGIGGGSGGGSDGGAGGNITITGGTVNANGNYGGAGIGGGSGDFSGGAGGEITISGGTVNATSGGNGGAGIGGGKNGDNGTFSTGDSGCAVIFASSISDQSSSGKWSGVIFQGQTGAVYGTNVTPTEDFIIPENYTLTIKDGQTLTISEDIILTNNGTIVNNGTINGKVSGNIVVDTYYLDTDNKTQNTWANLVTTGSTTWTGNAPDGSWYVVQGKVDINSRVTVTGNVNLILADGCKLTASQGINVTGGNSLTIYAQSTGENMGTLTANGANSQAGIGGGGENANGGTITINGGAVRATGGSHAAGIGGGNSGNGLSGTVGSGGAITINGGTVIAQGGSYGSAGIGGGGADLDIGGAGGTIIISGGAVTATGHSNGGAGIGGGNGGAGGEITISGGMVNANGGNYAADIGGGNEGPGGKIIISGGTVTASSTDGTGIGGNSFFGDNGTFSTGENGCAVIIASRIGDNTPDDWSGVIFEDGAGKVYGTNIAPIEDFEIPESSTLTIGDGKTLTISEGITLTNNGTITVESGGALVNKGTIGGSGKIQMSGGSTVQIGENGPEITIGKDTTGATVGKDGSVTLPNGGSATIGSGDNATTISTPKGGMVAPDTGAVTPEEDGSVVIGSGEDATTITPPSGQPVTPNRDGSVTIPGGSTVQIGDGESITIPPEGDTLLPDGSLEDYTVTVTFDSQGGSQVASQTVAVGTAVTSPADPTRSGYSFQGWYTAANGDTQWNFADSVTGNMTLFARWTQNSSGGGGGSTSRPTYPPTMDEPENGAVTTSPSRPEEGDAVTITPKPDEGFELDEILVKDEDGEEIKVTQNPDGTYTFTQPDGKVTITVTFRCDGGELCPGHHLTDVRKDAWYHAAVDYVVEHGIMEGMSATTFSPNTEVTRAQAVQILYNLEGQPDLSDENLGYPYEDVDAQAWYGDAVYWARITGVATGYGDGTFQPGDSITRQEFAQMLYNYAKYKGYDLTAEGDLSQFPDSDSVADWAEAAMSWANSNELINGHDNGTIDAGGTAIRAQAASILMRFDQNLVKN